MIASKYRPQAFCAVLVLAGVLAYGDSFGGEFIHDDLASIVDNPSIRHLSALARVLSPPRAGGLSVEGRPILNLSLAANYAVSGTAVWSYHALNLAIHLGAGLALFGIVLGTLRGCRGKSSLGRDENDACWFAFSAALLWTVHPLQTGAVTYVIQRAESLMGLFYLLTLYGFIRGAEGTSRSPLWFFLSWLCCLLAMGTKEVAVTLPVMVLMYDRCFVAQSFKVAWRSRWRYYLGLAAAWAFLAGLLTAGGADRSGSKGFGIGVSWWAWERTQFQAIAHYLRLAIWPHPLVFDYGTFWVGVAEAAPYAAVVLILAAATCWALAGPAGSGRRQVGFLGFWFFGILAVSSFVPGKGDMIAEYRMYLPLAGVATLAVAAMRACLGSWSPGVLLALASVCAFLTWHRNRDFSTDLSIWSDTAAKRPANMVAQYNLGVVLSRRGRYAEEAAVYERALARDPDIANIQYNLGVALEHLGRLSDSLPHFREAVRLGPALPVTHYALGLALAQSGRPEEAVPELEEAMRLQPDSAAARRALAAAEDQAAAELWAAGKAAEAKAAYQEALRAEPGDEEARRRLEVIGAWEGP